MDGPGRTASMGWGRFAAMIATSTVVMFFLMYHLVYEADHAMFSLTRLIGALMMGAVMVVVMLGFMWRMYAGPATKLAVLACGIVAAAALLAINRDQTLVDDARFMKAMIPHHSIAINNACKAQISDPRVRALADGIIASQVREIAEMKALIADLDANGPRGDAPLPPRKAELTPDMLPQIREAVR